MCVSNNKYDAIPLSLYTAYFILLPSVCFSRRFPSCNCIINFALIFIALSLTPHIRPYIYFRFKHGLLLVSRSLLYRALSHSHIVIAACHSRSRKRFLSVQFSIGLLINCGDTECIQMWELTDTHTHICIYIVSLWITVTNRLHTLIEKCARCDSHELDNSVVKTALKSLSLSPLTPK